MKIKAINTTYAPAAIGPYSQAIEANGFVYVSGQLPIDPSTGSFVEGGIQIEARQSLTNIKNILAEAGLGMENVVKVTVLLADINNFAAVNDVYAEFFQAPYPARSAFAVAALPKGANIEIEAIASR
ncbi:MAG: RidA family protein [Bacteroidaceae bacterium]|nr:RidA family protein [Bacteroidaceae bacterium]